MNWVPLECMIKDLLEKRKGGEPWVGKITLVGRLVWLMAQRLWLGKDKLGGPIGWEYIYGKTKKNPRGGVSND